MIRVGVLLAGSGKDQLGDQSLRLLSVADPGLS